MEADTVGQRLRDLREKQGLSRPALAAKAHVRVSAIHAVESGKRHGKRLTLETGIRLARALGVSLDYLAGTYEEMEG
jgi:transcriptional regulator with XRE-family HTH domain